ncbi:MAG: hypothetical protein WC989_04410 [Micavibrio sp.]
MNNNDFNIKTDSYGISAERPRPAIPLQDRAAIGAGPLPADRARKLAADFSLALEHGAAPAARNPMREALCNAEEESFPVACVLSFGC